jgi:hypothetical protein
MEQEKIRLILRQLKDIQAQADKIISGENSPESVETFALYSTELKNYIISNISAHEIISYLQELPEVDYSPVGIKWWEMILLPWWGINLYNDYKAREIIIQNIAEVRGKYGTLELLLRELANQVKSGQSIDPAEEFWLAILQLIIVKLCLFRYENPRQNFCCYIHFDTDTVQ